MADYTIYNSSGAVIEDVNAGDDDLAEGFNEGITLDETELAALLDGANAADLSVWPDGTDEGDIEAFAATFAEEEGEAEVWIASSDGTSLDSDTLAASALITALEEGNALLSADATDEERRKAGKTLSHGPLSSKVTT